MLRTGSLNHLFVGAAICFGFLGTGSAEATVYYEYELAAQTGASSLVSIEDEVSINERGQIAFIGDQNAVAGFESVYVGAPGVLATSINPSFSASGRTFGPGVEINAASPALVASRDAFSTSRFLRLWNAATGAFTTLDSDAGPFDDVGFRPGMNDSGQVTHGAFVGATNSLVLPGGGAVTVGNLVATRPAIADDGSVVARVGPAGTQADPIIYYNPAGSPTTIASSGTGWTELGRAPGISADGSIVVWSGNRGNGLGVFAARVSSPSNVTRIAGENATITNPDLGYDAAGMDIFLTFTAAQRDSRVGIALQETAGPGLTAGNSFVVTFQGTPSAGSIDNPTLAPGTPLFFSNQAGLWAVRVDLENELDPAGPLVLNANSATPVAQIGETLHTPSGSFAINGITELYDPIANVALDSTGMPRTQRRGDHQIAFRATSGANTIVIRAVQRDSDEDGLYDHWERTGGGIDVDRDGTIDLNLNALGANPLSRDIFIEIDWSHPRNDPPRSYSNQPADGALKMVASVFNGAPALPNGIPASVKAHIDAGTGTDTLGDPFSQNFSTGHQGGNLIGQVGMPTAHLDLVYFGLPGSFSIPGGKARSFAEIKQNFFGSADKFAREFAFHYVVLADSAGAFEDFVTDTDGNGVLSGSDTVGPDGVLSRGELLYSDANGRGATPSQPTVVTATGSSATVSGFTFPTVGLGLQGSGVLITSGAGAGQLRQVVSTSGAVINVTPPWTTIPGAGDTIALLSGSSGLGEVAFRSGPNFHAAPGNDLLMTLGAWPAASGALSIPFIHWRTVVHEVGHNLGLRHCGTNPNSAICIGAPAAHESLMSYAHQANMSSTVNSYSPRVPGTPDPTFDDWFNLRPDFNRAQIHLGNTSLIGLGAGGLPAGGNPVGADNVPDHEPDYGDFVQTNGPMDVQKPTLDITSPNYGASFLQGQNLPVVLTATDNIALAPGSVNVRFDVDGSGAIDQTGETLAATPTGNPNQFTVTFTSLAGPDGVRKIDARATDTSSNIGQDIQPIFVPEPGVTLMLLLAVPLIGLLQRKRNGVHRERPSS
jgi:hypothetical protein